MKKLITVVALIALTGIQAFAKGEKMTYLEITLKVQEKNRPAAAAVYKKYKQPFLTKIAGAKSKDLLIRTEDVQVLHGFDSKAHAESYLKSELFTHDVVNELKPLLEADPEVRIYEAM